MTSSPSVPSPRDILWLIGNSPRGLTPRKRQTYIASVTQSDALFRSALTIEHSAKPILLYYALAQAGNAIIAASPEVKSSPRSHGLKYDADEAKVLGDVIIKLDGTGSGNHGAFQLFCQAMGFEVPSSGSATLAQLWNASLDRYDTNLESTQITAKPLPLQNPNLVGPDMSFKLADVDYADLESLVADYPRAANSQVSHAEPDGTAVYRLPSGAAQRAYGSSNPLFMIGGYSFAFLAPGSGSFGELEPMVNTWLLMYGLSIAARYLGGLWQLSNLEASRDYLPVREYLDIQCSELFLKSMNLIREFVTKSPQRD